MSFFKKTLFFILIISIMLLLHHVFRTALASLFLAPLSIAIFLGTFAPAPVAIIAVFALLAELLTTLPFGTMLIVFAVPFFSQWIMKSPEPDITWKFFFATTLAVLLQILVILLSKNGFHTLLLQHIPITIALTQLIFTSVGTYILIVIYHEFSSRI
jgi:hypothetical protein